MSVKHAALYLAVMLPMSVQTVANRDGSEEVMTYVTVSTEPLCRGKQLRQRLTI